MEAEVRGEEREETTVKGPAATGDLLGEVDGLVRQLALCRHMVRNEKDSLQRIHDQIEQVYGPLLKAAKTALARAREVEDAARSELDAAALKMFWTTGDKQVHPAVTIKSYTVLDYNESEALEYAREHLPQALKLNRGAFDRTAKTIDLAFVNVLNETRVFIAQHLDEYL